ncbi:MAG TPA: TIGR01777 family oxidoreductase [Cyclobacteriaceae bacterium]
MNKVLITGASGLVGTRLTEILLQRGHQVSHVSRSKKQSVKTFVWDVEKGKIDSEAFKDVDTIIHLAGEGVAEKRWSKRRKQEILESRTKSTALLARHLAENQHVKTVICASAIGYYGFDKADAELTEESPAGNDFLAQVVNQWEQEADKIRDKRLVKFRIGIVLSHRGGALVEMTKPIRWGLGAPLGTGHQYISWIHLDDLCNMFMFAIENQGINGVYNATGPYAVTNKELTKKIAQALHKPLWLPPVPAFVLKIIIGEMADVVVSGSVVSSKKIQETGFKFMFPVLERALENLLEELNQQPEK